MEKEKIIRKVDFKIKTSVLNSIRTKLVLVIVFVLIVSAPIARYLGVIIEKTGVLDSSIGVYINSGINIFVITLITLFFLNRMVIDPLKQQIKIMNALGKGDLSKKIEVKGKDEFAQLNKATNNMINNIRKLIEDVKQTADKSETYSQSLASSAEELSASEQTGKTFDGINESVNNVVEQMNLLDDDVSEINKIKDKVLSSIENITSITQQTAASSQQISASAQQEAASIQEVSASIQELNKLIKDLYDSVKVFKL